jgi:hypothetical protein
VPGVPGLWRLNFLEDVAYEGPFAHRVPPCANEPCCSAKQGCLPEGNTL